MTDNRSSKHHAYTPHLWHTQQQTTTYGRKETETHKFNGLNLCLKPWRKNEV